MAKEGLYTPKPIKFENYNLLFRLAEQLPQKAIPSQINSDIVQNFGMRSSNELNVAFTHYAQTPPKACLDTLNRRKSFEVYEKSCSQSIVSD